MSQSFEFKLEHPHEPIDAINAWQEWSRQNRVVAQMDDPLVTKDSREHLHDTTNATKRMTPANWNEFFNGSEEDLTSNSMQTTQFMQTKATEYFDETICEFIDEMTAEELFNCFYTAAKWNLEHATKQYDKAKDLIDTIEGKFYGKK